MRSSFASFYTGLSGMRASQYALDITGHNVVNIGTGGYTRQRIDQYSLSLGGSGSWESKMGQGVMISGVSQIRDPYLDVRFRTEIAQVGYSDSTLQGLKDLESILNEVGVGTGITKQFEELASALARLASEPKNPEFENIVRSTVSSLSKFINQYAKKIDIARGETETDFTTKQIPEINALMKSISDLNVNIESSQLDGNPALELIDQRNILIDQLSQHIKIDVQHKSVQVPGTNRTIDQLNIYYVSDAPNGKIPIIEGTGDPGEFSSTKDPITGKIDLSLLPSNPKLPTLPLGGYPPVAKDKIDSLNDLLKKIADGNTATMANGKLITDMDAKIKTEWDAILKARNALAAGKEEDKAALAAALKAAEATYTASNEELKVLKTARATLKKDREPTLLAIQKLLPDARFKDEDGNMKITFPYGESKYTLVDATKSATFAVTGTDSAILNLKDAVTGETKAIGTYPNLPKDKVQDVNYILKKMELLERGQIEKTPPPYDQENLIKERKKLVDELKTIMPKDTIKTSAGEPFKVSYTQGGKDYALIEGTLPPASFFVMNNALMLDEVNPPEKQVSGLFENMMECGVKGTMQLLNCEGSFNNTTPGEPRGYGYYTKMLDTLAFTLADSFNKANEKMLLPGSTTDIGGAMFESSVKGEAITAKNIRIAEGWANGDYGLIANRTTGSTSDMADNLLYMETLLTSKKTQFFDDPHAPNTNEIAFTGTFRDCFTNMDGMLGIDIKTTDAILTNHLTVAGSISDNIDSVSSVSLDEEGVNMMHYQKSLNAAIRFMTTMDEALNTVINSMGIVGR